jgi:hypothetical protein
MTTVEARIKQLLDRILRCGGFGRIEIQPDQPLPGCTATIQMKATEAEQNDVKVLLSRLEDDYEYKPGRDRLELQYERGTLTYVRIAFSA